MNARLISLVTGETFHRDWQQQEPPYIPSRHFLDPRGINTFSPFDGKWALHNVAVSDKCCASDSPDRLHTYSGRSPAFSSSSLVVFSVTLGGRTISAVSTLCAVKPSMGATRGGDN